MHSGNNKGYMLLNVWEQLLVAATSDITVWQGKKLQLSSVGFSRCMGKKRYVMLLTWLLT